MIQAVSLVIAATAVLIAGSVHLATASDTGYPDLPEYLDAADLSWVWVPHGTMPEFLAHLDLNAAYLPWVDGSSGAYLPGTYLSWMHSGGLRMTGTALDEEIRIMVNLTRVDSTRAYLTWTD